MQEEKIWGTTERTFESRSVTINVLRVKKGGVCSWHYHNHKYNHFHVISGKFQIRHERPDWEIVLESGGSCTVGPGRESLHEFEALEDSVVIETCYVYQGEINQNDIHRLRLGYYKHPDGTREDAPNDGTVEDSPDGSLPV